jgi:hypothetical protein
MYGDYSVDYDGHVQRYTSSVVFSVSISKNCVTLDILCINHVLCSLDCGRSFDFVAVRSIPSNCVTLVSSGLVIPCTLSTRLRTILQLRDPRIVPGDILSITPVLFSLDCGLVSWNVLLCFSVMQFIHVSLASVLVCLALISATQGYGYGGMGGGMGGMGGGKGYPPMQQYPQQGGLGGVLEGMLRDSKYRI